jgi:hypothetical protein
LLHDAEIVLIGTGGNHNCSRFQRQQGFFRLCSGLSRRRRRHHSAFGLRGQRSGARTSTSGTPAPRCHAPEALDRRWDKDDTALLGGRGPAFEQESQRTQQDPSRSLRRVAQDRSRMLTQNWLRSLGVCRG